MHTIKLSNLIKPQNENEIVEKNENKKKNVGS